MSAQDRRTFLGHALGAAALAATVPAGLEARSANRVPGPPRNATATQDEAYWRLVKQSFPLARGLVLLNAANLCPSPFEVQNAVFEWTRGIDRDPSFQNRAKFGALRQESREAVAALVGASPEEIALTRNTSEGNNQVVTGLELGPGDEVLIWDQNHPTNSTSWDERAKRKGFSVRRLTTPAVPSTAGELAAAFDDATGPATRVLAFSHVSNLTGVRVPAAAICRMARSRGILTLVDGAQSCGILDLDLHAMGCDFFTASTHKWLTGPKEAGILYVRSDVVDRLWAADVGIGWTNALENGARKFETLGQRDDACVAAMATAVGVHTRIGADVIEARVLALVSTLKHGLRQRLTDRVTFHTPSADDVSSGVVVFKIAGVNTREAYSRLYDEHHVAGAGMGGAFEGIRLSPHFYNTMEDIERAVDAVASVAG